MGRPKKNTTKGATKVDTKDTKKKTTKVVKEKTKNQIILKSQ